mgnify:CR=1 FL=1
MSEAQIIDGKVYSERVRAEVAQEVARLRAEHDLQPGLAVILVGEDAASQVYVRSKGEQSLAAGMHSVEPMSTKEIGNLLNNTALICRQSHYR